MSAIIYIEGPKGSGKSTFTKQLNKALTSKGIETVCLTEPGGTELSPMGSAIREIIKSDVPRSRECEALLFQASRVETYKKDIEPFKDSDKVFLVDRSIFSTLVTQFTLHGVEFVPAVHRLTNGGYNGDLCCWLLPPIDTIVERLDSRNDNYDIVNARSNHQNEYNGYLKVSSTMERINEAAFAKEHLMLTDVDLTTNIEVTTKRILELLSEANHGE